MDQTRPLFVFLFFSHDKYSTNTANDKRVDGVFGTRTRGSRMVGADEFTAEPWLHTLPGHCFLSPSSLFCFLLFLSFSFLKMGQSRPLFLYFRQPIQKSWHKCLLYFFADDCIRTADLWSWKVTAQPTEPQPRPNILPILSFYKSLVDLAKQEKVFQSGKRCLVTDTIS